MPLRTNYGQWRHLIPARLRSNRPAARLVWAGQRKNSCVNGVLTPTEFWVFAPPTI
jgi:hypothetical protein